MSINPSTQYPGKIAADANYPYGKAKNITSPGDGTGTPWEAALVNDIFGFQQYLLNLAGITPSGTPDSAATSQYFEALWELLNVRALTYNIVTNADLTLMAAQNLYAKLTITDTGVILTTGRNVVIDNVGRNILFTNSTAQTLTVKTVAGTGVAVPAGTTVALINDGVNVSASFALLNSPVFTGTPTAPVPTVVNQLITMGNIVEKTGAAIGYGTGSGGTVTQATSKSTAVTLNKPTGQITMNPAALAANTAVQFTLNNTLISSNDVLVLSFTGAVNYLNYNMWTVTGTNAATIFIKNISAGSLSEAVVINYSVIKGAIA